MATRSRPRATGSPDAEPRVGSQADAEAGATPTPRRSGGTGLARGAIGVLGHTGGWAAGAYLRVGRRVVGTVIVPSSSVELVRDVATETSRALVSVAHATELDRRLEEIGPAGALIRRGAAIAGSLLPIHVPAASNGSSSELELRDDRGGPLPSLREQGEDLLRRSRDVNDTYDMHPAYARILSEMAPDEARILQLMLVDGPQATVDVRTGGPLGLINSRLIAPGLSMIGSRAGCRYSERVPSYLNNLFRLGLIWFSQETLRSHARYQVLEAQPDVLEAIHSVAAAKVVRRSVHLTPFGEDLCRFCFTDGVDIAELPEHSTPKASVALPPADKSTD